jgi:hypothetical protein
LSPLKHFQEQHFREQNCQEQHSEKLYEKSECKDDNLRKKLEEYRETFRKWEEERKERNKLLNEEMTKLVELRKKARDNEGIDKNQSQ